MAIGDYTGYVLVVSLADGTEIVKQYYDYREVQVAEELLEDMWDASDNAGVDVVVSNWYIEEAEEYWEEKKREEDLTNA